MKTINFPSSVKIIQNDAFWGCEKLSDVKLPAELQRIEDRAFLGVRYLKTLQIPDQVTYIGSRAFDPDTNIIGDVMDPSNSFGLVEVNIPLNIQEIGEYAFANNQYLSKLTVKAETPIEFSKNVFVNGSFYFYGNTVEERIDYKTYEKCTLIVPSGCEEIYSQTEAWKYFINSGIVDAESIEIKITGEPSLYIGETLRLSAVVYPENTSDKTITWKSDNDAIATVSSDGTVIGVSAGVANITATCGTVSATCKVTVNDRPHTPTEFVKKGNGQSCTFVVMMDLSDEQLVKEKFKYMTKI